MIEEILDLIVAELKSAEAKHPGWPTDPIHGAAIVAEESGELVQAAIDYVYTNGEEGRMVAEAVQTAAMGIRFLLNVGSMARTQVVQIAGRPV